MNQSKAESRWGRVLDSLGVSGGREFLAAILALGMAACGPGEDRRTLSENQGKLGGQIEGVSGDVGELEGLVKGVEGVLSGVEKKADVTNKNVLNGRKEASDMNDAAAQRRAEILARVQRLEQGLEQSNEDLALLTALQLGFSADDILEVEGYSNRDELQQVGGELYLYLKGVLEFAESNHWPLSLEQAYGATRYYRWVLAQVSANVTLDQFMEAQHTVATAWAAGYPEATGVPVEVNQELLRACLNPTTGEEKTCAELAEAKVVEVYAADLEAAKGAFLGSGGEDDKVKSALAEPIVSDYHNLADFLDSNNINDTNEALEALALLKKAQAESGVENVSVATYLNLSGIIDSSWDDETLDLEAEVFLDLLGQCLKAENDEACGTLITQAYETALESALKELKAQFSAEDHGVIEAYLAENNLGVPGELTPNDWQDLATLRGAENKDLNQALESFKALKGVRESHTAEGVTMEQYLKIDAEVKKNWPNQTLDDQGYLNVFGLCLTELAKPEEQEDKKACAEVVAEQYNSQLESAKTAFSTDAVTNEKVANHLGRTPDIKDYLDLTNIRYFLGNHLLLPIEADLSVGLTEEGNLETILSWYDAALKAGPKSETLKLFQNHDGDVVTQNWGDLGQTPQVYFELWAACQALPENRNKTCEQIVSDAVMQKQAPTATDTPESDDATAQSVENKEDGSGAVPAPEAEPEEGGADQPAQPE